jgi:hypothetical protein
MSSKPVPDNPSRSNVSRPISNPHMWIPYQSPQAYDEVCALCGAFSGAHNKCPDPPEVGLDCPEPWPQWDEA